MTSRDKMAALRGHSTVRKHTQAIILKRGKLLTVFQVGSLEFAIEVLFSSMIPCRKVCR